MVEYQSNLRLSAQYIILGSGHGSRTSTRRYGVCPLIKRRLPQSKIARTLSDGRDRGVQNQPIGTTTSSSSHVRFNPEDAALGDSDAANTLGYTRIRRAPVRAHQSH